MKNEFSVKYTQSFKCEVPVYLVAEMLLSSYTVNIEQPLMNMDNINKVLNGTMDVDSAMLHDCQVYIKDIKFYTHIVTTIIDNIMDNEKACSDLYNALNGWTKTETPMERTLHEQTQDACDDAIEALAKSKDEDDLVF